MEGDILTSKVVAIYTRVSTTYQQKGLDAQEHALKNYCKEKGIENYKLYQDFGISGAKISRPELNKMMEDCRQSKINTVIVYSFSRFARSTTHLLTALDQFNTMNIQFVSITENIDTNSPLGKALYVIISALNCLERELISERVRCGLISAKAKGKILGRPADPKRAELIRELYEKKYSYSKIAKLVSCSPSTVCNTLKRLFNNTQTNHS